MERSVRGALWWRHIFGPRRNLGFTKARRDLPIERFMAIKLFFIIIKLVQVYYSEPAMHQTSSATMTVAKHRHAGPRVFLRRNELHFQVTIQAIFYAPLINGRLIMYNGQRSSGV